MASRIKDFFDTVHEHMAVSESNSALNKNPFYDYGDTAWSIQNGQPPQIRYKKAPSFRIDTHRGDEGIARHSSGSLGTLWQDIDVSIWAADEEQCLQNFERINKYIHKVAHPTANPTEMQQYRFSEIDVAGTWDDRTNRQPRGEVMRFGYTLRINLRERGIESVQFLTASIHTSGSTASGSYVPVAAVTTFSE